MVPPRLVSCLVLLVGLFNLTAAKAETLVVSLSAEGWVTTQTAVVHIQMTAVPQEGREDKTRARVFETLETLAADADWHVTRFQQSIGQAGLTTWTVGAQARVTGAAVNDLTRAVKKASEPGFQVRLNGISHTPSLAERMAARMKTRAEIRQMAAREAALLSETGDQSWHVVSINFAPLSSPAGPQMLRSMAIQAESMPRSADQNVVQKGILAIPVAERFSVQGIVTLETVE